MEQPTKEDPRAAKKVTRNLPVQFDVLMGVPKVAYMRAEQRSTPSD